MTADALARKLQVKETSRLWVWPGREDVPAALDELIGTVESADEPSGADSAVLLTRDRQAVDDALSAHLDALAGLRAIWVIYAKGNRTDINRDTLWNQLATYGWRAVTQISVDATYSALRIRPLKPGENPHTHGGTSGDR